jgi:superfamily II DNA/RNA helicase
MDTDMDMDKNMDMKIDTTTESTTIKEIKTWDELNLHDDLLRGIYRYGFENPTPIQQKAILPIVGKQDLIAQAQSGTGKTGSFTIGTLQLIDITQKTTQALILAPTHELVKQIYTVVTNLGIAMDGLVVKTLIGGTSIVNDINDLNKNCPHIVIGTTGRVYDMIRRKKININTVKIMVLDEADEMLSKGFKEQIYNIFQFLNPDIQVALFSATMPRDILTLTEKFMRDPIKIILKPEELSLECIQQYYIALQNDELKYDALKDLFSLLQISQCIIYVNTVKRVDDLYNAMTAEGFPVCYIHSSMDKSERESSFLKFRNGSCRVLISSNVTARGIDIQQVSTVINFDITHNVHTYLHAIGRSGRYGRKGLAINFVTRNDIEHMRRIEKYYGISIKELPADVKKIF